MNLEQSEQEAADAYAKARGFDKPLAERARLARSRVMGAGPVTRTTTLPDDGRRR